MIRVRVASPTAHGCTCTIEYTTEVLRNRYPIRKYESTTLYCRPYVYGNRYEGTKVPSKVRKYLRTHYDTFVRKYEGNKYESTKVFIFEGTFVRMYTTCTRTVRVHVHIGTTFLRCKFSIFRSEALYKIMQTPTGSTCRYDR